MKIFALFAVFLTGCVHTVIPPPYIAPSVTPVKTKIHDAKDVVALAQKSNYDGKEIIKQTQTLAESLRAKLEALRNRRVQP